MIGGEYLACPGDRPKRLGKQETAGQPGRTRAGIVFLT
jgi:hypothetical protein